MTTLDRDAGTTRVLRNQEEVEAHIRAICFKTGPPRQLGAELEWTVHHTAAPDAPLDAAHLRRALGRYAPATLDPPDPPIPLPAGGRLTTEPGGQLEISSAPATSPAALHAAVTADLAHLTGLLDAAGLRLGEHGLDPHREPLRLLDTPRYAAMESLLDRHGPHGRTMMCSTAGLQVCLDAGTVDELPVRWAAVLALGPPLVALFANSRRHAGRDSGLASARMAAWWGMDPRLSHPPGGPAGDPAAGWVRYALAAPLLCVRRGGGYRSPPPGATLADWVAGAVAEPLTADDVDYHLSTLFPPVRPRGYLEVRYLDTQPGPEWIAGVALVAALLGDPATTERALEIAAPVAGCWVPAYRIGLRDPALRRRAAALAGLAADRPAVTGLPPEVATTVVESVEKRLRAAEEQ
jgi:glutamate--cysteine ligase